MFLFEGLGRNVELAQFALGDVAVRIWQRLRERRMEWIDVIKRPEQADREPVPVPLLETFPIAASVADSATDSAKKVPDSAVAAAKNWVMQNEL